MQETDNKLDAMMVIENRLTDLRQWMKERNILAYVVPTVDPHNNEFVHDHFKCREWLSGFTGSAGLLIVTYNDAALWVDSRYTLQAQEQIGFTSIKLMKDAKDDKHISPWFWIGQKLANLQPEGVVAHCCESMLTLSMIQAAADCRVKLCSAPDAFDTIWTDRPAIVPQPIERMAKRYTGTPIKSGLDKVAKRLRAMVPDRDYLFNDLCDIAYILNLRGHDIPYTPVFFAYLLYRAADNSFTLFTHQETLTEEARASLDKNEVKVLPYEMAMDNVSATCMYDPDTVTQMILNRATNGLAIPSPIVQLRMIKTDKEQESIREAMILDGVAMVTFLRELEQAMQIEGMVLTEMDIATRLTELRAKSDKFIEPSFTTIAAYGPNGAVVHYEPEVDSAAKLQPKGLLLLDSGGQYQCGTTDITRTIALGPVTREESQAYTYALKAHLALARAIFPEGISGVQLDAICRQELWNVGYDFGHGTGHGVGMHLCVHEGPMQIRKEVRPDTVIPFKPGIVVTNEPGIYVEGKFGVRIENVMVCLPWSKTPFGEFCYFDQLTLCPYDLRPVDFSLLTDQEVAQINYYHGLVREVLMPYLTETADKQYLEWATQPIE